MTLEQQRAALAYRHVSLVKESAETERKIYGSMALKLPVLIRTAGLCQALHFIRSRKKEALDTLLQHLAEQLRRVDSAIDGADGLLAKVRAADLSQYLWLSREALAAVEWYARLAQSELKIDRTEDVNDQPSK